MIFSQLSHNKQTVLTVLYNHDHAMTSADIAAETSDMTIPGIGTTASLLRRTGLVRNISDDRHVAIWEITGKGRDVYRGSINGSELSSDPAPVKEVHLTGSNLPPTVPDHFVYVVSEDKLAQMLSSRLGVNADEINLLRARVRTLEQSLTESERTVEMLRRRLDIESRLDDILVELRAVKA